MELCPVCRKKYKSSRYETCFDCLPDRKKNEVLERRKEKEGFPESSEQFSDKSFTEEP
jgi:hypothetical protein